MFTPLSNLHLSISRTCFIDAFSIGSWAIRSTAKDILKFLAANIAADVELPDGHPPQLKQLLAALKTTHVPRRLTDEEGFKIGLGWRVQPDGTHSKSGSGDGFESIMFFNSQARVALIVLSNSYIDSPHDTTTTGSDIFSVIVNAYRKG